MNKKKKFISLNVKLALAVVAGIVLAFLMYIFCTVFGNYIISIKFLTDGAVRKNVGAAYKSLENYIKRYDVKGTDNDKLSKWLKKNDHTYLLVYDNYDDHFEAGWSNEPVHEVPGNKAADPFAEEGLRIDKSNFPEDVKNRIIRFADREYYVFIDTYKELAWSGTLDIVTICLCFATLLATVLVYNARVLRKLKEFSDDVQRIAGGDLAGKIHAMRNDEIGMLASNVDNMRNSIIQKHESERLAWEANGELITAMSHDIRSPLTSIIGYLDIIEDRKYAGKEELDKYIKACRGKAFQLKELSDELFRYFLVFGDQESSLHFEKLDAALLFRQILGEHNAEIIGYGYKVAMDYPLAKGYVLIDISAVRRLFDNIYSNIVKYADPDGLISITAADRDDTVDIKITNSVSAGYKKAESTKIGLHTCEMICSRMKGEFSYHEKDRVFASEISFPLIKG